VPFVPWAVVCASNLFWRMKFWRHIWILDLNFAKFKYGAAPSMCDGKFDMQTCNTCYKHTATHCSTLQHTATHRNTL